MNDESDTEVLQRKPLLKAVLDYSFKKLQSLLLVGIASAAVTIYDHHQTHNQIWNETGNHFQDLVNQVRAQQTQIEALTNEVNSLFWKTGK